ncbi:unnamed protein product [Parnassius mnemosyne]|uniref:Endonuclease/exonuclease/phosphatase domain-containing protein n=1 Tax=Parnassius mnemosyne TaxID=213953 RepID=A0AAV1LF04_9NEOP
MLSSFYNENIHAILVSESGLKPCLPSTSYYFPGFHLIRNDRLGRAGGGVAIYLRSHIPYTVLNTSQPLSSAGPEHLFIEVLFGHLKLLLGVYYSPNVTIDYFSAFEIVLEQYSSLYNHTIVMGDFNTCLLKNDARASRLKSLVNGINLHILPLSATHAFPNCVPSLLDLILVSSIDHVAKHGQCNASAFSYHDLLYLCYKLKPPKAKRRILLRRNFSRMDLDKLREDTAKVDWSVVANAGSVDEQISIFNSILTQLYEIHAPIRPVRMKHLPAPWLTADIKKLQEKKNTAKTKYRMNPNDSNRDKYNSARNRCNMVCRDSQRRHIYKSVVEEDNSTKVWNFLKSLGVGKAKRNVESLNLNLNKLNAHFLSSATIESATKKNTLVQLSAISTPNFSSFVFSQVTVNDVKKNILAITSDAVGSDSISRKMIIPLLDLLAPILTLILNRSFDTSVFPSSWKDGQ